MNIITKLEIGKRNKERINVYIDDEFAFSLSAVGVAVTDNRLRDYILNAYKLKIIPEDFYEFYNKTLNIRNTFAHQYKKPTTKELVKLYKDNRDILKNFESFINDRLKIHIKNNRKDLLSLYDE